MKLKLTILLCALLVAVPMFAAGQPDRCGTKQPGDEEIAAIEQGIARGQKGKATAVIQTWVHVISGGAGFANGEVPDSMIREQMRVLNDSFNGRSGGANTGFAFDLAGITRTTNAYWFANFAYDFNVELEAKSALKVGGPSTLNIYLVDGGAWLGWAYFPGIATDPTYGNLDGVVLDWRTLPGGPFTLYSEGDTAPHEVGHWLALYHTFDGRCGKNGDYVADTAAEFSPAFNCPIGRDTCFGTQQSGPDPIHNFMDYTADSCMYEFTKGQASRMQAAWAAFRN